MRPSPDELLASVRLSLNETLLPKVEDRWARYVGTAMDLVLQHVQLRLAGELDVLDADSADMVAVLAAVGGRAAALGAGPGDTGGPRWGDLADLALSPAEDTETGETGGTGGTGRTGGLSDATVRNEELRGRVVAVMGWLDQADPRGDDPDLRALRDEVHQLVRRQVDRTKPLVEPLFMAFGPVAS